MWEWEKQLEVGMVTFGLLVAVGCQPRTTTRVSVPAGLGVVGLRSWE